jgi:hypothetical protein
MSENMSGDERHTVKKLHQECTTALATLLKESEEMCRALSALRAIPHPWTNPRPYATACERELRAEHLQFCPAGVITRAGWI